MENNWTKIPSDEEIKKTVENISKRGIEIKLFETKKEALEEIKRLIPPKVSVQEGSSVTLKEIGFTDFLNSGKHSWKNLHEEIAKENDAQKRSDLRRKSTTADVFLGSVNAISENGEIVACDNSGSRVSAYLFAAKKVILVAGIQKITPSLEKAIERVREYVWPLESERAKKAYGSPSNTSKWMILEKETTPHRITLILIKEKLGY